MNEMRVGVIMGGSSREREVSLRSGAAVAAALESRGHREVRLELPDAAERALDLLRNAPSDCAFLAFYG